MIIRARILRPGNGPQGELLPSHATQGAAGLDLRADVDREVAIPPLGRAQIPTGLAIEIPPGYEGQIRSRSGLAAAHGVVCLNGPGTVDSDYRGEVLVLLVNLGSEPFRVRRADRIAQLVICRVESVEVVEASELTVTPRGDGGLGSTGI